MRAEKTEIKKNAQLIEAKIKDLQNKILDAGGVKLRAQKSKVEGIREQIEALGDKVTKTKVAKNKAEKDIAKLGNQITKHEKELAEVSEELERLEQDIKEKTQEAVGIRKRAEEAKQVRIYYSNTEWINNHFHSFSPIFVLKIAHGGKEGRDGRDET